MIDILNSSVLSNISSVKSVSALVVFENALICPSLSYLCKFIRPGLQDQVSDVIVLHVTQPTIFFMLAAGGIPFSSPLAIFRLSSLCLSSIACFPTSVKPPNIVFFAQESEGPFSWCLFMVLIVFLPCRDT